MSNGKKITIEIILIFAAIFFYTKLSSNEEPVGNLGFVDAGQGGTAAGSEFIILLGELRSIKLDNAFFVDTAFQSLKDSSVTLFPVPVGRRNPFAPLGAPASF